MKQILIISFALFFLIGCNKEQKLDNKAKHQQRLQEFVDMRFGMFICYNIMSYGAKWGEANYPIDSFNPQDLDCAQWADAAVSAGMKFGLLTTKHHEGFCLWDSQYTEYDVASTPYKKDIVKQYVDAFRDKGLEPGLYYSIWDSSNNIDKGQIDDKAIKFIKGQLTELLTNYGKIKYLVFDGWFWRFGHNKVPFNEIRDHVRKLQPDCLITDHTHMQSTFHVDIPYFEGPFGAFPKETNSMASALGHCSVKGNGWFWSDKTPHGLIKGESAATISNKLKMLESRYCNFLLNCMPNRDGLLDTLYIDLLEEIGTSWSPNSSRPILPQQVPPVIYEVRPVAAIATSGEAEHAFDASKIAGKNYYDWLPTNDGIQSITFDLGKVYNGIELMQITQNHRCKPAPETSLIDGNIKHCKLYGSTNGDSFKLISEEKWKADGDMKSIEFNSSNIRYLKLEILDYEGKNAIVNEIIIGAHSEIPTVR
ncbi:alpha-L-fucosidase [Labilibacter marinus]|uniref:alpha-L-fucosidase n=1 Tax=Labilibacter marinus TaxID=1477105 RepID=UPI00094FF4F2|nr:alpha-L-fucosidase [Labilibacter marinus]